MAIIDTYKNNISRKRDELSKLSADKAKESEKRYVKNKKLHQQKIF